MLQCAHAFGALKSFIKSTNNDMKLSNEMTTTNLVSRHLSGGTGVRRSDSFHRSSRMQGVATDRKWHECLRTYLVSKCVSGVPGRVLVGREMEMPRGFEISAVLRSLFFDGERFEVPVADPPYQNGRQTTTSE